MSKPKKRKAIKAWAVIQHLWRYFTSPTYRFWVDFCTQEEMLNRNMKMIEDNLRLRSYPMYLVEGDKIKILNPKK